METIYKLFPCGHFAVAIVEVTMNTEKTGYGTTVRSAYLKDYDGVSTVINDVEK